MKTLFGHRWNLTLSTTSPCTITAQVDLTGDGNWMDYQSFEVSETVEHSFPKAFSAYWIRFVASENTKASAVLRFQ